MISLQPEVFLSTKANVIVQQWLPCALSRPPAQADLEERRHPALFGLEGPAGCHPSLASASGTCGGVIGDVRRTLKQTILETDTFANGWVYRRDGQLRHSSV